MKKFKRLMALAAVSMLGIQLMGAQAAFAVPADVNSECDFGSDNLEITLGYDNSADASDAGDKGDAGIWVASDGKLYCEDQTGTTGQAASSIDSITVEMDDDDSNGQLTIYLDDIPDGSSDEGNAAEWPSFDTFDVNITTRLVFDGSYVEAGAANGLSVTVGKSTFSFSGTEGTYAASSLEFVDGGDDDVFDASKATVRVYADGDGEDNPGNSESGDDVFKGGSGNDRFEIDGYATGDDVIVYGNAGNDLIRTGDGNDQGWGGEGSDTIDLGGDGKDIAAPGAGDDDIESTDRVSYGDLSDGIEYVDSGLTGDVTTGGAAGDDTFTDNPTYLIATGHDDVIVDSNGDLKVVSAGAGNDVVKVSVAYVDEAEDAEACLEDTPCGAFVLGGAGNDLIVALDAGDGAEDAFYGNTGSDILKGKGGNDELRGGPGQDQAWGGNGAGDLCTAEVLNRCEYIKK